MATGYGVELPIQQFFGNTGAILNGGKLYTYAAGTSTPQATYTDSALLVPNANPIILDSAGRAVIYLPTNTAYKFVLNTSADVLVWSQDNVSLISVATPPAPAAVPTGAGLPWFSNAAAPSGYLLCDGSAVDRTVYAALFAVLSTTWGAGDGVTTFNLPDTRGKALYGKATAGTGSTFATPFGAMDHTHTGPSHTHSFSATTSVESGDSTIQSGAPAIVAAQNHTHTVSGTSGASGTAATGTGNPPGTVCFFIVKT